MFGEITLHLNQAIDHIRCSNGHDVVLKVRKNTKKCTRLLWCPHCKIEVWPFTRRIDAVLKG
jgi:translation initiation factor IF-1